MKKNNIFTALATAFVAICGTIQAGTSPVDMSGLGDKICPPTITARVGNQDGVSIERTVLRSDNNKLKCVYEKKEVAEVPTTANDCRHVPVNNMSGVNNALMKLAATPAIIAYIGQTPVNGKCKVRPIIKYTQK